MDEDLPCILLELTLPGRAALGGPVGSFLTAESETLRGSVFETAASGLGDAFGLLELLGERGIGRALGDRGGFLAPVLV